MKNYWAISTARARSQSYFAYVQFLLCFEPTHNLG
jgi:hypothetical protein